MTSILNINSSARRIDNERADYNSISRQLGQLFLNEWRSLNRASKITERDLSLNPPSFITQDWIASVFTPEENRTNEQQKLVAESDRLIEEVAQADLIVITAPMYNYGMPAVLKAWFDQVIRIHKTFSFDLARGDFPLEPILSGKTLILLSSCGEFGFETDDPRGSMNHLGPHIKTLGRYLGIDSFYEIRCEYQEFADERHRQSLNNAKTRIISLAEELSQQAL